MVEDSDIRAPGEFLERYESLGRVAGGGQSVGYRVRSREGGEDLFAKVLHLSSVADFDERARMQREAQALMNLGHSGIPRYVESSFETGHMGGIDYYLVTEFIGGEDLGEAIGRGVRYTEDEIREVAREVYGALSTAHAKGIIHRDVKPSNIMVEDAFVPEDEIEEFFGRKHAHLVPKVRAILKDDSAYNWKNRGFFNEVIGDGESETSVGRVVLTDFGIAKLLGNETSTRTLAAGTPNYMAPEQLEGVSPETDIYSLGLVLLDMAKGSERLNEARYDKPEDDIVKLVHLSEDFRESLRKMVSLDPRVRRSGIEGIVTGEKIRVLEGEIVREGEIEIAATSSEIELASDEIRLDKLRKDAEVYEEALKNLPNYNGFFRRLVGYMSLDPELEAHLILTKNLKGVKSDLADLEAKASGAEVAGESGEVEVADEKLGLGRRLINYFNTKSSVVGGTVAGSATIIPSSIDIYNRGITSELLLLSVFNALSYTAIGAVYGRVFSDIASDYLEESRKKNGLVARVVDGARGLFSRGPTRVVGLSDIDEHYLKYWSETYSGDVSTLLRFYEQGEMKSDPRFTSEMLLNFGVDPKEAKEYQIMPSVAARLRLAVVEEIADDNSTSLGERACLLFQSSQKDPDFDVREKALEHLLGLDDHSLNNALPSKARKRLRKLAAQRERKGRIDVGSCPKDLDFWT